MVGNSWALFLSSGELTPVGSCPRSVDGMVVIQHRQMVLNQLTQLSFGFKVRIKNHK